MIDPDKISTKDKESSKYLVCTDLKRFLQVLINLVSNATKFTSCEGTIKVVTTLLEAENLLRVDVIDTGIGIEENKKDKLFKLFGCI